MTLTERPTFESSWPPPLGPPAFPPFGPPRDWYVPTPGPPRRRRTRLAVVAVAALVAIAAGAIGLESQRSGRATSVSAVNTPTTASAGATLPTVAASRPATSTPLDTPSIVALVDPAVVDITTTLDGGEAAGTGMVLTASGLVLTNNHVINGATKIDVQIAGSGPTHPAHVVGYDVSDDVALVQIEDISGLKTITVGDSTSVAVQDRVVAIGNALGSAGPHAVSTGTVDALDQAITANDPTGGSQDLSGLIEHDATLRPGDSGGPLVNTAGQVVGMNAVASISGRRITRSTSGYAIPMAKALDIARQIQTGTGSATIHIGERAILGIQVTAVDASDAGGAAVSAVSADSPAAGAGIERGTVITSIDTTAISSVDDLGHALFPHSPGDKVKVTWNDTAGTSHTATVQLGAGPPA